MRWVGTRLTGVAESKRGGSRFDTMVETTESGTNYLRLLRRVVYRVSDLSRELMEPLDLTPQQAIALIILVEREGCTQAALVAAMDSDPNTVSGLVRRLEQRQLLTRERHARDARAVNLKLTPEGAALAVRAQAGFDRLASALSDAVPKRSGTTVANWLKAVLVIADV